MKNSTQTNGPALVHRDGKLKATVWRNEGEKGPYFTTTLARIYSDAGGNPKDTHSFSQTDLLRLAELSREAYGMINDLKRDLSRERSQENTQSYEAEPDQSYDQNQPQDDSQSRETFKQQRRQQNGQTQAQGQRQ